MHIMSFINSLYDTNLFIVKNYKDLVSTMYIHNSYENNNKYLNISNIIVNENYKSAFV